MREASEGLQFVRDFIVGALQSLLALVMIYYLITGGR